MGGFEEFLKVFGAVTGDVFGEVFVFDGGDSAVIKGAMVVAEFDGADRAESTFVAEDEIYGFVLYETIGSMAVLSANFVIEKGRNGNIRDDIKLIAKELDEKLETAALGAFHKALARAVATVI